LTRLNETSIYDAGLIGFCAFSRHTQPALKRIARLTDRETEATAQYSITGWPPKKVSHFGNKSHQSCQRDIKFFLSSFKLELGF